MSVFSGEFARRSRTSSIKYNDHCRRSSRADSIFMMMLPLRATMALKKKKEKYVTHICVKKYSRPDYVYEKSGQCSQSHKGILSEFTIMGIDVRPSRDCLTKYHGRKRFVLHRESAGTQIWRIHSSSWPGTVDDDVESLERAAPFGAILCRLACILSMQRMQSVVTEGVVC